MKTDNQLNSSSPSAEDAFKTDPYKTLQFDLKDGKVESSYGPRDGSIASDVHQITECVKGIIQSKRDLFRLEEVSVDRRLRPPTSRLEMNKLGECFLRCLQMDLDRVLDTYPSIGRFNRYFDLFHKAVMREIRLTNGSAPFVEVANDEWLNSGDWKVSATNTLIQYVRPLNDVVDEIRRKGNSQAFRDWIEKLERQPASNRDALWSLVLACLNVNHHLSVLRFDLGYAKHYCDPELSGGNAITYEDVRGHRRALRRFLKRDLSKMLPAGACNGMGFAIKLEFGLDKTFHFHVLVILNGDVIRQHAVIAEMICHYWNETITHGVGGSYSCFRSRYVKEGIGSIRYNDEAKLRNLEEEVVPYVTKADFYIDMVKGDGHRSFWKSQPPKIEAKRKGRKRSKTGVALPLVKPKPVADFEECLARFSNNSSERFGSLRNDSDPRKKESGSLFQSIGAVTDSDDIPWHSPAVQARMA
ncbi:hypothetical protein SY87_33305 [Burkholderia pseudomallei]|uniref:hypothetical protein n=1 Tax=Burkholderia pseudomallei TaxID=28450 RepID=UPI0005CA0BB3|nr:hypothetical protein [Burkholderia pseudomallei]KIX33671.1 hypothetical protein SY87_33305 [Burkholderia pseudomallei]